MKISKLSIELMLLFVFVFSFSLFSMEAPQSDRVEILRSAVRETIRDQDFTLLDLAAKLIKSYIDELNEIDVKFGGFVDGKATPTVIREAARYYPLQGVTEADVIAAVKTAQGRLEFKSYLKNARKFFLSNNVALTVLHNSFKHAAKNPVDFAPLLHEVLRLIATTAQDSSSYKQTSAKVFFAGRLKLSNDLLAILLSHVDIAGLIPVLDVSSNELIQNALASISERSWYFMQAIPHLQRFMMSEEVDDVFYLESAVAEKFCNQRITLLPLNSLARAQIRATELFKILDVDTRERYQDEFGKLNSYHIYLGTIETFTQQLASEEAAQKSLLLAQKKEGQQKGKKSRKKDGGKKGARSGSRKDNRYEEAAQTPYQPETTDGLVSELEIPVEELVNSAFGHHLAQRYVSLTPIVDTKSSVTPKKKKTVKAKLVHNNCGRPDYQSYIDQRQIERTNQLAYTFDEELFDDNELFSTMGKVVNANASEAVSQLFLRTKGYKNITAPNLATYFIRFHGVDQSGKSFTTTFQSPEVYMSGGKAFESKTENKYAVTNKIVCGFNCLGYAEQEKYYATDAVRRMYLRNTVFAKLRNYVEGSWFFNALDSEALIFLDLMQNKLATYVSSLEQGSTIQGVVIGIKSLYKSCYRCGNLMPGFQRAMQNALTDIASSANISVATNLHHMIIVDGEKMPVHPIHRFMGSNFEELPRISTNSMEEQYRFRLLVKE